MHTLLAACTAGVRTLLRTVGATVSSLSAQVAGAGELALDVRVGALALVVALLTAVVLEAYQCPASGILPCLSVYVRIRRCSASAPGSPWQSVPRRGSLRRCQRCTGQPWWS